jgi:hypothetical protein
MGSSLQCQVLDKETFGGRVMRKNHVAAVGAAM